MATAERFGLIRYAQADAVTGLVEGKVVDKPPRCGTCGRAIADYAARPWSIRCRHCKRENKRS